MVETEHGGWPVVEPLVDLCALSSWSAFEIAEATDAKHLVNTVEAKFAVLQRFSDRMCWLGRIIQNSDVSVLYVV